MKKNKIIICLMILIMCINMLTKYCIANTNTNTNTSTSILNATIGGATNFVNMGANLDNPTNAEAMKEGSNFLYNLLFMAGISVALIWGMILGIKFLTGTVEGKAEISKGLVPYVVGCVIIFATFGIWKLALEILRPIV